MAYKYLFYFVTLLFILVSDQVGGPVIPSQKKDLDKAAENMQGDNEKMLTYSDALKYEPNETKCILEPIKMSDMDTKIFLKHGQKYSITCLQGYDIVPHKPVECLENGSLSHIATCHTINFCSWIPKSKHLIVHQHIWTSPYQTANFSCEKGMQLIGVSTTKCSPQGNWDMIEFPRCEEDPLSLLPNIQHGSKRIGNNTAEYLCDSGYHLEGNGSVWWQDGGKPVIDVFPVCKVTLKGFIETWIILCGCSLFISCILLMCGCLHFK